MKLTTTWVRYEDSEDAPWLVSAYDEITADEHGGVPDFYTEELSHYGDEYALREVVIEVPDRPILEAFDAPTIPGRVIS